MKWYERASFVFVGLLYIGAGLAVLKWPAFLYYAVAAVFVVQGLFSFARAAVRRSAASG